MSSLFFIIIIGFHIFIYNCYNSIFYKKYNLLKLNYIIIKKSIKLIIFNLLLISCIIVCIPNLNIHFSNLTNTIFDNTILTTIPMIDIIIYIYNLIYKLFSLYIQKKIPIRYKFLNFNSE